MDSNYLILALLVMTLGGLLAISVIHFGWFLRGKENRDSAKSVIEGDSSAHTAVRGGSTPEHLKG